MDFHGSHLIHLLDLCLQDPSFLLPMLQLLLRIRAQNDLEPSISTGLNQHSLQKQILWLLSLIQMQMASTTQENLKAHLSKDHLMKDIRISYLPSIKSPNQPLLTLLEPLNLEVYPRLEGLELLEESLLSEEWERLDLFQEQAL